MSKTNTDVKAGEQTEETPPEGTEVETPSTETDESTETEETTDEESEETEDEKDDELPEWARKKLSKANSEAGKYRTQLRELQQKFEGAKTPEEFEAATAELRTLNETTGRELAIEKALRKHGLGDDDAVFLTATSADDIAKQAEALASRIGSGTTRLRGGLDPTEEDEGASDPKSLAKSLRKPRF